jgi:hypothetical protein
MKSINQLLRTWPRGVSCARWRRLFTLALGSGIGGSTIRSKDEAGGILFTVAAVGAKLFSAKNSFPDVRPEFLEDVIQDSGFHLRSPVPGRLL